MLGSPAWADSRSTAPHRTVAPVASTRVVRSPFSFGLGRASDRTLIRIGVLPWEVHCISGSFGAASSSGSVSSLAAGPAVDHGGSHAPPWVRIPDDSVVMRHSIQVIGTALNTCPGQPSGLRQSSWDYMPNSLTVPTGETEITRAGRVAADLKGLRNKSFDKF